MNKGAARWLPGRALFFAALVVAPLSFLRGTLGFMALAIDIVLVLAALVDAERARRISFSVTREIEPRFVAGKPNRVCLQIRNPSTRALHITVRDDAPHGFVADNDEYVLVVAPSAHATVEYFLTPHIRGLHAFGDLHIRVEGALHLGAAIHRFPAAMEVKVFPDLATQARYDLAMRLGDLKSLGVREVRVAGGAGEFDHLREYTHGDSYRDLDWKSSAKRLRPVTRVHRQERSQNVIVAIDAGRWMALQSGERTKLDIAIESALLLAHVALRQGDRVGLIVFGADVRAFVPPNRGPAQYRRILEALYAIQADDTLVDFRRFVEYTRARVPRRSLVVMFSDLLDESHGLALIHAVPILKKRHVPVCVSLEDRVAQKMASRASRSVVEFFERAAASDVLTERDAVKSQLVKGGVEVVEAARTDLAVAVVNRYLMLKSRAIL